MKTTLPSKKENKKKARRQWHTPVIPHLGAEAGWLWVEEQHWPAQQDPPMFQLPFRYSRWLSYRYDFNQLTLKFLKPKIAWTCWPFLILPSSAAVMGTPLDYRGFDSAPFQLLPGELPVHISFHPPLFLICPLSSPCLTLFYKLLSSGPFTNMASKALQSLVLSVSPTCFLPWWLLAFCSRAQLLLSCSHPCVFAMALLPGFSPSSFPL